MNILLIGSGGREHALAYKISQSDNLEKLYILPGNPGTEKLGINLSQNMNNWEEIATFCSENQIELVVIGPEQPLVEGMADFLRLKDFAVFGPGKSAARIEGDKAFAKNLMRNYNIPTAEFKVFEKEIYKSALSYLNTCSYPVVIKASGLAAGKGVVICDSNREAELALKNCFENNIFGSSGDRIVIEEFLEGEEASIFAITDGKDYVILPSSQDHKRIYDNDEGKNTGGMGAYAPAPIVTENVLKFVEQDIIIPTLKAIKIEAEEDYIGCLYCGIIITKNGPKVIEYNCRFGDPETQVVLPILSGNFLNLLYSAAMGNIDKNAVKYDGACAVCVVAASKGYPGKYERGFEIEGLNRINSDDTIVFHAGTKMVNDKTITNGGRVLGIINVNKQNNLTLCKENVYNALDKINFDGIYYRKDISNKAFRHLK